MGSVIPYFVRAFKWTTGFNHFVSIPILAAIELIHDFIPRSSLRAIMLCLLVGLKCEYGIVQTPLKTNEALPLRNQSVVLSR